MSNVSFSFFLRRRTIFLHLHGRLILHFATMLRGTTFPRDLGSRRQGRAGFALAEAAMISRYQPTKIPNDCFVLFDIGFPMLIIFANGELQPRMPLSAGDPGVWRLQSSSQGVCKIVPIWRTLRNVLTDGEELYLMRCVLHKDNSGFASLQHNVDQKGASWLSLALQVFVIVDTLQRTLEEGAISRLADINVPRS